jgi:hypothetical protein
MVRVSHCIMAIPRRRPDPTIVRILSTNLQPASLRAPNEVFCQMTPRRTPGKLSLLELVPFVEHPVARLQKGLPHLLRNPIGLRQGLEFPPEVGVTELRGGLSKTIENLVGAPTIPDEHPLEVGSQQGDGLRRSAPILQQEGLGIPAGDDTAMRALPTPPLHARAEPGPGV